MKQYYTTFFFIRQAKTAIYLNFTRNFQNSTVFSSTSPHRQRRKKPVLLCGVCFISSSPCSDNCFIPISRKTRALKTLFSFPHHHRTEAEQYERGGFSFPLAQPHHIQSQGAAYVWPLLGQAAKTFWSGFYLRLTPPNEYKAYMQLFLFSSPR